MSRFQFILFYLKKMIALSYLCIRIILPYKRIERNSVASSTSIEAIVMLIKLYGSNVDSFYLLELQKKEKLVGKNISRIPCTDIVLSMKLIMQCQLYPRKKRTRYTLSYFFAISSCSTFHVFFARFSSPSSFLPSSLSSSLRRPITFARRLTSAGLQYTAEKGRGGRTSLHGV